MVTKEEILEKFKLEEFRLIGSYIKDLEEQVQERKHQEVTALEQVDYNEIIDIAEQEELIGDCLDFEDVQITDDHLVDNDQPLGNSLNFHSRGTSNVFPQGKPGQLLMHQTSFDTPFSNQDVTFIRPNNLKKNPFKTQKRLNKSLNGSIFSVGPLKIVSGKDDHSFKASHDDFSVRTSK